MPKNPHLVIIDPAIKIPELESFNRMANACPVPVSYHLPALFGFNSLEKLHPDSVKGIVILGSLSSVNEALDWQKKLSLFINSFIEKKTPLLGLCFGHQFLAHHFGAKVEYVFENQQKYLGFRKVSLQKNPLWGESKEGDLYVSHNEHVVNVPKDFVVSATSSEVKIDGLSHSSLPIWSFQSHPEAGPKFLELRENRVAPDPKRFEFGHKLIDQFIHFCLRK